jgi:acetyl esterase/lipase
MKKLLALITICFLFNSLSICAQYKKITLWPTFAPGTENRKNNERWEDSTHVYDIYQPDLTAFLVEKREIPSPAIIICPGGGYRQLAIEKEGYKIARWLNKNNISAFVLKYRLNPSEALQDIQRAVSLLRSRAEEFNIEEKKIGIIGFSAGAHLAGNLITHSQKSEIQDKIDSTSARPDFWIGVYGSYEPRKTDRSDLYFQSFTPFYQLVDQNTPPAFLVHAGNDSKVPAEQSIRLYMALRKNDVAAELHIYQQGEHGFALEKNRGAAVTSTVNSWSELCIGWLKIRGILSQ